MKTREQKERKREIVAKSMQKARQSSQRRGQEVERRREGRRKKKISDLLVQDELLLLQERVRNLKKYIAQLEGVLQVPPIDQECPQEILEEIGDQPEEEIQEEEEEEKSAYVNVEEVSKIYLSDPKSVKEFTSLDLSALESLHNECKSSIEMTTWRGQGRKSLFTSSPVPTLSFLFFTLCWLKHYPTIGFLSAMFKIHSRTCTRILKRTITALSKTMEGEIKFPSDNEMASLMYTYAQNDGFATSVCVVDGTEIQISRPSKRDIQRRTWSGKKHQNALNVMIITKLNGEIIYFSPLRIGAHDQSHWKELELRKWFIEKPFGILGDGGFAFNPDQTEPRINGKKPVRKPRTGTLTTSEKQFNQKLSEMRVVVENSIRVIKTFKIMSTVFRHWRYGRGQINGNDILHVCVCLANRRIKQKPLRDPNWKASHWEEVFRRHSASVPPEQ